MKKKNSSYVHPYPHYGYNSAEAIECNRATNISALHINEPGETMRETIFLLRYKNIKNSNGKSFMSFLRHNGLDQFEQIMQWVRSPSAERKHYKQITKLMRDCCKTAKIIAFKDMKLDELNTTIEKLKNMARS